jgi:hypothetical protein
LEAAVSVSKWVSRLGVGLAAGVAAGLVAKVARPASGAFRSWCRERYNRAIQRPAMPSAGQLALKRWLASR